jgi:hypothetical protein
MTETLRAAPAVSHRIRMLGPVQSWFRDAQKTDRWR